MKKCELCEDNDSQIIWQGDDSRIILIDDPFLPGFCRVIWNRHVSEMTDLSFVERELLMTLVFAVEDAVRHVMRPDKINLASMGNMVPHLHWHVVPRYSDDPFFPATIWSEKVRVYPEKKLLERRQLASQLPSAIKARISALS